jgi:hypothetical protein
MLKASAWRLRGEYIYQTLWINLDWHLYAKENDELVLALQETGLNACRVYCVERFTDS